MNNYKRHYFELKGKSAENILHGLALKTFLSYWCFLNPRLENGKELCDLLVVFDGVAIIWQVKNIKTDKNDEYNKREVEKNFRQLYGAKRKLFELESKISLINKNRKLKEIDVTTIKEIFLIAVFIGESQIHNRFPIHEKKFPVHVFMGKSIQILLNELDTVSDFLNYLKERERFFLQEKSRKIIFGGEEDLLGFYLDNDKHLHAPNDPKTILTMCDYWDGFRNSEKYLSKKKEDDISYFWDSLVDKSKGRIEDSENYERLARIMARPDRYERRHLSKAFLEARLNAHKEKCFRRILISNNIVYCFLFENDSTIRSREKHLAIVCWIVKGMYPKNKIVGIATEPQFEFKSVYDFVLIDNLHWTEDDQKHSEQLQKEFGYFLEPVKQPFQEPEYPIKN